MGQAKRSRKKQARSQVVSEPRSAKTTALTAGPTRDWLWGLILVLAVVITYQPVWSAGYLWDDDDHLTANPCIVGPLGFWDIWTSAAADICPFTRSTFWLEHALWGLAPLPYHVVNVAMQAGCALVLWRVLRMLAVPGAWLGAAFWALHPVQVESVAWISEMKNTESGLFYLLSIFFFLKWLKACAREVENGRRWNYGLSLVFAALAMASKSSTVVLPVVWCLAVWWREGRWQWRQMVPVIPVLFMTAAASALSIWTQGLHLATITDPELARSWPQRVATAGDAVWFYLGKLAWPHPLLSLYPRWQIDAGDGTSYLPLLAVVVALVIFWQKRDLWARPWFFAFAYFLAALVPVLGLIDNPIFRLSLVFDHLQYLASMGPLALVGAGMSRWANVTLPGRPYGQGALGAGVLLLLGGLSWWQASFYQSEEKLWTHTLAYEDDSAVAHNNLGAFLREEGRMNEAIPHFQKALAIKPNYPEAHSNLGYAFLQKNELDQTISEFQEAVAIAPTYIDPHLGLGTAYIQKGQLDQAIPEFQRAVALTPGAVEAHNDLGNALAQEGRTDEAIMQFRAALRLRPGEAGVHNDLGNALLQNGQIDEAIDQYRTARKIDPGYAEAANDLGYALLQKGRVEEAITQFRDALRLKPGYAYAQNNLAKAEALRARGNAGWSSRRDGGK